MRLKFIFFTAPSDKLGFLALWRCRSLAEGHQLIGFMMKRSLLVSSLVAILALTLSACAGSKWFSPAAPAMREVDCERLFTEFDRLVAEQGTADAGAVRVPDFPELRLDRFLASFAEDKPTGKAYAAWFERMRKLDETVRLIEWRNLPPEAVSSLIASHGPNVGTVLNVCGQILAERDLNSADRRARLLSAVEPPDAYSTWRRLFGFYFLSRWAIVGGVWRVQREMREPFITPVLPHSAAGLSIRYGPAKPETLDAAEVAEILQQSTANPLRIPEPSTEQLARLFSGFAPVWVIDTENDNDRIGSARIDANGINFIDTTQASVYRLPSHTRYGGQVLLQLNYLIWFPARPAASRIDIYAGRFDGLIWRVTLGPDGKPLAYDSIHPCGCYYQIFPGEGVKVVQPQDGSEPILSPMPILGLKRGQRLAIHLGSGSHFIHRISVEKSAPESVVYDSLDYDQLRSLTLPNGRQRSFFDQDGLVTGSERAERFLLWPMGVPSAGAMRQWGTHAIAFLGKRHFDDPWLLEKLIRPLWK
ncbi:hypothetical protein IVG45_04775 [Methylomonas sp. LL1]|uniref:hypothetical protein n=1 Tax=Methylomonas sp. LL1 TaxID=2785785 RepID=UPI0018C353CC|nr:hypothetical protein [Methylomonas sp. LL1]QPK64284.1 hypothetical protein IVG45_04775 [Methylomonas sp. LL1]